MRPLPSVALLLPCAALLAVGCGRARGAPTDRLPGGWRLVQKQDYQALYRPSGRIERLLHDGDHDGVADAVILYKPDGTPDRSELDTNGDHVVDRWETLRPDGTATVVATSRRGTTTPDTWYHLDARGSVYQVDYDDDGDGVADRSEPVGPEKARQP